jgi:hypothetical protein
MKRAAVAAVAGAAALAVPLAGCGGASYASAATAKGVAQRFVASVTAGHRDAWCPYLSESFLQGGSSRPASAGTLQACENNNLFLITGSCDRYRALDQAQVTKVTDTDAATRTATVSLSTGAEMALGRVGGAWLVTSISAATHPASQKC